MRPKCSASPTYYYHCGSSLHARHVVVIREVFRWDTYDSGEKDTPPPEWPSSVNRMITPDNIFKCDQIRFRYEFIGNTSEEEGGECWTVVVIDT